MNAATTTAVTLHGTPKELGMQLAVKLLTQPLNFAAEQLSPQELDQFCCALLSATAGLIARKVGVSELADMVAVLADVSNIEAVERKGPLQ